MRPSDYDLELADSHYREVLFTIDPDQITSDTYRMPRDYEERFDTQEEANEAAQKVANEAGQPIEVIASGFWGIYGREYLDTHTVQPKE